MQKNSTPKKSSEAQSPVDISQKQTKIAEEEKTSVLTPMDIYVNLQDPITKIDLRITKFIYDIINSNKIFQVIPNILGLIPYEIYVLPGMFLAIFQVIWTGSPNPVQFHLFPHFFAYSVFQGLKKSIHRPRPGCVIQEMNEHIKDNPHCYGKTKDQSFPSGHTGIMFALAVALYMEMTWSQAPRFFDVPIFSVIVKYGLSLIGFIIAIFVALHRVSKGFHSFFDVVIGAIIGSSIGFLSWYTVEYYKKRYYKSCKASPYQKECDDYLEYKKYKKLSFQIWWNEVKNNFMDVVREMSWAGFLFRFILTIVTCYSCYHFLRHDLFELASLFH